MCQAPKHRELKQLISKFAKVLAKLFVGTMVSLLLFNNVHKYDVEKADSFPSVLFLLLHSDSSVIICFLCIK